MDDKMHPNARIAIDNGIANEAVNIEAYINGEAGNFTADFMRTISEKAVVFNGFFKHNGRRHFPDGYVQIGRTMHIFEMKDGDRYNEKYEAQVMRYAHVMNIAMDFDTVITYIIYGSREEVEIETYHARDIHVVYEATRTGEDKKYSWKVDQRESMTDDDRVAFNEKQRAKAAKRTPEQKAVVAAKQKESDMRRNIRSTPAQKEVRKVKNTQATSEFRARRTPEAIAVENEKQSMRHVQRIANYTPEEFEAFKADRRIRETATRERRRVAKDVVFGERNGIAVVVMADGATMFIPIGTYTSIKAKDKAIKMVDMAMSEGEPLRIEFDSFIAGREYENAKEVVKVFAMSLKFRVIM